MSVLPRLMTFYISVHLLVPALPVYAEGQGSSLYSMAEASKAKKTSKNSKKKKSKTNKKKSSKKNSKSKKKKAKTPTPTPTATFSPASLSPQPTPNATSVPTISTTEDPVRNLSSDISGSAPPSLSPTSTPSQTPPEFPTLPPTVTPQPTTGANDDAPSSGVGTTTIPGTTYSVGFTFGGSAIPLNGFEVAPGPPQPANVKNYVLKSRFTPYFQVAFYIRKSTTNPAQPMSLEFKLCNNPLYFPDPSLIQNNVVPSQKLVGPIELHVSGGARLNSMHPQLSPFSPVSSSDPATITYKLLLPTINNPKGLVAPDPTRLADGACIAEGFILDGKPAQSPPSTLVDIAPLFPPNPGKTLWGPIDPNFPAPTLAYMTDWANATLYFDAKSSKAWDASLNNGQGGWATLLADGNLYFSAVDGVVMDEHQTGFHWDWSYARASGYYLATGNISGILAALRGIYTVFNRPQHFEGLDTDATKVSFVDGRPALSIYGTSNLGRPHSGAQYATPADSHGWLGIEVQHGSFRAGSEIAMLTGLPMIWEETRYYGELAKAMLRSIDPKPAPAAEGFCNTPRGYVSLLEAAYRAYMVDPGFDMTYPIQVVENFIKLFHEIPFAPNANLNQWIDNYNYGFDATLNNVTTWAKPLLSSADGQPLFAMTNNKWSICPSGPCNVAVIMEEGRFASIALLVGFVFNRPTMLAIGLELLDWWSSPGKGYYISGSNEGIKWFVNPTTPTIFADPTGVNYQGYGNYAYAYAAANAFNFAGALLNAGLLPATVPGTPFSVNGNLFLELAQKIKSKSSQLDIGPNNYNPASVFGWYPFP